MGACHFWGESAWVKVPVTFGIKVPVTFRPKVTGTRVLVLHSDRIIEYPLNDIHNFHTVYDIRG